MNKIFFLKASFILMFLSIFAMLTFAEELKPIQLLKPQFNKDRPTLIRPRTVKRKSDPDRK